MFDNWRFLEITGPIREALATEEALLDSVHEGPIFIIWRSKPHSVSIPKNEDLKSINLDMCTLLGADWSRRVSDGETVYHNHLTDFSYSMIVPLKHSEEEVTKELMEIVKGALRYIGIPVEIKENGTFFVDGKKISASSQYISKEKNALIHHGYILYEIPSFLTGYQMINSSRSVERRARESIEKHAAITEYVRFSFSDVVNAFLETTRCQKMFLKNHERKKIEFLLENKYNNDTWQRDGNLYN